MRSARSKRFEQWVEIPRPPGSKAERNEINTQTGKTRRLRPSRWKGATVNARQPVRCPKWIADQCEHCEVCGERSDQVSLGVSWQDAEQRLRMISDGRGGYRSRGPILWTMHVIKLERFAERHFECGAYAPRSMGGQMRKALPQYLVYALRFGNETDVLVAVERAKRAGVSEMTLFEITPPQISEKADLVPF